jgi:hypothetical protein
MQTKVSKRLIWGVQQQQHPQQEFAFLSSLFLELGLQQKELFGFFKESVLGFYSSSTQSSVNFSSYGGPLSFFAQFLFHCVVKAGSVWWILAPWEDALCFFKKLVPKGADLSHSWLWYLVEWSLYGQIHAVASSPLVICYLSQHLQFCWFVLFFLIWFISSSFTSLHNEVHPNI